MVKKACFFLFCLTLWLKLAADNELCGLHNHAFSVKELLTFTIYYSLMGFYIDAGTARFSNEIDQIGNTTVYHIIGIGNSNSKYDWIFKVRDRYETYIDTSSLTPLKFLRNIDEGGYKKEDTVIFNQAEKTATSSKGIFKLPPCTQDVMSAIYFARNIDFNKYKKNDKIPFAMFLDNQVYNLYINYMGKEIIKTKYGKFNAIKLKPLLIEGRVFKGGENMNIWISDDPDHIPLRIETPIAVGSLKVDMMLYRNLRYKLTSFLK